MKKTRFFIVAGAITMGIVGVFATKPEKKFAAATQIYAGGAYNVVLMTAGSSSHLTTVQGTLKTAFFKTVAGLQKTILTKAGGAKVYFKP